MGAGDRVIPLDRHLGCGVFISFQRMCDMQSQVAQFLTQRLPGDSQQPGCLVLVPARELEDERQEKPVDFAMCVGIEILSFRCKPLADECFKRSKW